MSRVEDLKAFDQSDPDNVSTTVFTRVGRRPPRPQPVASKPVSTQVPARVPAARPVKPVAKPAPPASGVGPADVRVPYVWSRGLMRAGILLAGLGVLGLVPGIPWHVWGMTACIPLVILGGICWYAAGRLLAHGVVRAVERDYRVRVVARVTGLTAPFSHVARIRFIPVEDESGRIRDGLLHVSDDGFAWVSDADDRMLLTGPNGGKRGGTQTA